MSYLEINYIGGEESSVDYETAIDKIDDYITVLSTIRGELVDLRSEEMIYEQIRNEVAVDYDQDFIKLTLEEQKNIFEAIRAVEKKLEKTVKYLDLDHEKEKDKDKQITEE